MNGQEFDLVVRQCLESIELLQQQMTRLNPQPQTNNTEQPAQQRTDSTPAVESMQSLLLSQTPPSPVMQSVTPHQPLIQQFPATQNQPEQIVEATPSTSTFTTTDTATNSDTNNISNPDWSEIHRSTLIREILQKINSRLGRLRTVNDAITECLNLLKTDLNRHTKDYFLLSLVEMGKASEKFKSCNLTAIQEAFNVAQSKPDLFNTTTNRTLLIDWSGRVDQQMKLKQKRDSLATRSKPIRSNRSTSNNRPSITYAPSSSHTLTQQPSRVTIAPHHRQHPVSAVNRHQMTPQMPLFSFSHHNNFPAVTFARRLDVEDEADFEVQTYAVDESKVNVIPSHITPQTYPYVETVRHLVAKTKIEHSQMDPCFKISLSFQISLQEWNLLQQQPTIYQVRFAWYKLNDTRRSYSIDQYPSIKLEVNGQRPITDPIKNLLSRLYGDSITTCCNVGLNTVQLSDMHCRCGDSVCVQLIRNLTIEEIVKRKAQTSTISIESAKQKVASKFVSEDEVEMTSYSVSVRDALSYCRMDVPGRGLNCAHIQCFDLSSFFELNKRTLTFKCPVCSTQVMPSELIVDPYFIQILESEEVKNDPDLDEVVINEDCSFAVHKQILDENKKRRRDSMADQNPSPAKQARPIIEAEVILLDDD